MPTKTNRSQQMVLLLVAFGAVVFGVVLAGSFSLTPAGESAQAPQRVARPVTSASSFADLAEAVLPAVVSVEAATIETRDPRNPRRPTDPFQFFFGPRGPQGEPREFRQDGVGSGFVITPDGWIVTNFHVIEEATQVKVRLEDREYEAEVKGSDPSTDLALIKIEPEASLKYLALGDSESLRVGDWVMAIGTPLTLASTVTVGVVSAKGRQLGLTDASFENFIQTDAAINRGNSGGPLVNIHGEVVGISTAMNFGAENIGFAVPVNTLQQILPQLRDEGRVRRGYLGVSIDNLDVETAESFGLASTQGALVLDVVEDTPAADAGLRPGDVILSVDDRGVGTTRELIDYISAQPPGTTVRLELVRDGKALERKVKLRERGDLDEPPIVEEPEEPDEMEWLGLQYQDLSRNLRQQLSIPRDVDGVVVRDVSPSSPLYEKGVRPGQVIVDVNGVPVESAEDFGRAVRGTSSGDLMRLYVLRFGPNGQRRPYFAIVRVP